MNPNTGQGSTEEMVSGMFGVGGIPNIADVGMGTQCTEEVVE